ncbi:MAG: hypothetical protein JXA60_02860 [Candidatus Coatesbacteria bacterium]|nr:hypothetical protein [Candidatus Coatesbacteria bacterium]
MKKSDIMGVFFLILVIVLIIIFYKEIGEITKQHPFILGFIKLFILGTFGEMIKYRMSSGSWKLDKIILRAFIWGLYGIWFTWSFAYADSGTKGLISKNLWLDAGPLATAFSTSLWLNILGGFAYFMMLIHEYLNFCIREGKLINTITFGEQLNKKIWFQFIPLTLFIWLVLHTFTYMLPEQFRVLSAALLAIVLGFLLSFGKK